MKQALRSPQALRHGLGLQVVTLALTQPLQLLGQTTIVQLPSDWQPTKPGAHWLGVQVLPGAGEVLAGHGPLNMKHDPSTRQQARGQGLGTHRPAGVNDTNGGTGHCDHGAMKQMPSLVQHAAKHGLGVQVFPAAGMLVAGQTAPATTKHAPVVSQQAVWTSTGHGIGPLQTPPGAGVVPVGQAVPKKVKQLPSERQQAIEHGLGLQLVAVVMT